MRLPGRRQVREAVQPHAAAVLRVGDLRDRLHAETHLLPGEALGEDDRETASEAAAGAAASPPGGAGATAATATPDGSGGNEEEERHRDDPATPDLLAQWWVPSHSR